MMKMKNVAAARTLIFLGVHYGNGLNESWQYVLRCISDMDRLHLIGESVRSPVVTERKPNHIISSFLPSFMSNAHETTSQPQEALEIRQRRPSLNRFSQELRSQSMILMIDRIFANTAKLDGASIVIFFCCLCEVASEEISEGRTYTLHKLVESMVDDSNLGISFC
jgi:brefeldin A-inhibited guanine nucleotide-exchange protein